jgi:glycosyltransferase involved in cell wall biosynthesis
VQLPKHLHSDITPKVSVVIPSFNCADYLPRAIDSILSQTMDDIEIIVVDDGSTDPTRQVMERYSTLPMVRYLYQENGGVGRARNAGAQASRGHYVAFIDADDALPQNALEKLCAALHAEPGACWCITDIWKVRENGQELQRSNVPSRDPFYGILEDDFVRRGIFFRREDFLAVGMYDESLKSREDWDINIRMLESGRAFCYIPEPLYLYSWRSGSLMTSPSGKVLFHTDRLLRKHHKRLADAGDRRAAQIYAKNMWDLGRRYFYSRRDLFRALGCIRESLAYDLSFARLFHPLFYNVKRLAGRTL